MATTTTVITQTILDTVLADVNAVVPNFSSLVSSYRLLVGSAEEIHRIPGVSPDVLARSIERFDRTGVLLDILIDLLCCKISFSSDFLAVTCAPVDLFRLLATRFDLANTPHEVAEEILLLEVLRRAEVALKGKDVTPPCTPPGPPPYTFATSFYQPPPPPPPAFPTPVPPTDCLPRTGPEAARQQEEQPKANPAAGISPQENTRQQPERPVPTEPPLKAADPKPVEKQPERQAQAEPPAKPAAPKSVEKQPERPAPTEPPLKAAVPKPAEKQPERQAQAEPPAKPAAPKPAEKQPERNQPLKPTAESVAPKSSNAQSDTLPGTRRPRKLNSNPIHK